MTNKKIAILGATSHIAKSLIYYFQANSKYELWLFARNLPKLNKFLKYKFPGFKPQCKSLDDFGKDNYSVIINCIGFGNPSSIKKAGFLIFSTTELYDNLILKYLEKNSKTQYINFSSGAVYGQEFLRPIKEKSFLKVNVNNLQPKEYYTVAKLNAEAKHRVLKHLKIIDLRIFSYFSRFIDLEAGFLLTEILKCLKNNNEFLTNSENIIRDYVHPQDLYNLITLCIEKNNINEVFDVYSSEPISKLEILDFFKNNYKLKYKIKNDFTCDSVTGNKNIYYSINKKARSLGYKPEFFSLETIILEAKNLLIGK